jgi:hypothetical protein
MKCTSVQKKNQKSVVFRLRKMTNVLIYFESAYFENKKMSELSVFCSLEYSEF